MEALLELRRVGKAFGGLQVISDLDLHVDEGEIVSVIGPNGAGKTTLFNLITGIYEPDAGEILLSGRSIVGLQPHKICCLGDFLVCHQPDNLIAEFNVRFPGLIEVGDVFLFFRGCW